MWTKDANLPGTSKTWQEALDYVKGINTGTYSNFGYTDWRLPNRKELQSLIDRNRYNPTLPSGHPFTNVPATGRLLLTPSTRTSRGSSICGLAT